MIELTGTNLTLVVIVAVIALAALVVAAILAREVLAADEGTDKMKEIAAAVQEGASAYLSRQFKTLSVFAVVVFFVLFLLPACGSQCAETFALRPQPRIPASRRP
jgi:K(+)-stimulated pyrophosphate-energized sodium pump